MASLSKRSWKFQDFQAHNANVNCLALGHKSGRVMVTGGDDKKVNLWAVGKQRCFMSLSGHSSAVDCVQFNQLEELVGAGSRTGTLKVWDLEAAKLVRTLNGHKQSIRCLDFHPYGDLLTSGSADCSIKIWDTRKKGVIHTYQGHAAAINSLKFSPDGQWLCSGSEDRTVKIWDLRIGKVLKQFANEHDDSVTCVDFHPHEFLLATAGRDRSVRLFDLESFVPISVEPDIGGVVRAICFNPDGECLFVAIRDYLKVIGWEPTKVYDSIRVGWGRVSDVAHAAQNQLIGASFHLTNVQVYVIDLKKCRPMGEPGLLDNDGGCLSSPAPPVPFVPHSSLRKSFSKAERPDNLLKNRPDVKTIEESTSGTDPEEEATADITNLTDYHEIFRGKGLSRTPPLEPEPFKEPDKDFASVPVVFRDPTEPQIIVDYEHDHHRIQDGGMDSFEALSLDDSMNYANRTKIPEPSTAKYSRSKSNLDQVYLNRFSRQSRQPTDNQQQENSSNHTKSKPAVPPSKFQLQRGTSVKEERTRTRNQSESNGGGNTVMKHSVSEASINRGGNKSSRIASRKNSFSKPIRSVSSSVPNVLIAPPVGTPSRPVDIYVKTEPTRDYSAISYRERNDDDFVPLSLDHPGGVSLDDFMPKTVDMLSNNRWQTELNVNEEETMELLVTGHNSMMNIMPTRKRNIRLVLARVRNRDVKSAVELAAQMEDVSTLVDILDVIHTRYSIWNLELSVIVLPKILDLLQSKYEQYMTTGCSTLKLILQHFGPVIRTNVQCPVGSFGVDIPREERYHRSVKCHELLSQLRSCVTRKLNLPGNLGGLFREVEEMMATVLD